MIARPREERFTVDEYEKISEYLESIGIPVELEEGRLIKHMSTMAWHSQIAIIIGGTIIMHLMTYNLPGIVTGETTGYRAADDDCPQPDVAYCSALDIAPNTPCIPTAPDLVVEVVSDPGNRRELQRLQAKRDKFLKMGTTVWEVWAHQRLVQIYLPDRPEVIVERQVLRFDRLPDLEIPLDTVFARLGDKL